MDVKNNKYKKSGIMPTNLEPCIFPLPLLSPSPPPLPPTPDVILS
jgi:hypothetical protein